MVVGDSSDWLSFSTSLAVCVPCPRPDAVPVSVILSLVGVLTGDTERVFIGIRPCPGMGLGIGVVNTSGLPHCAMTGPGRLAVRVNESSRPLLPLLGDDNTVMYDATQTIGEYTVSLLYVLMMWN